MTAPVEAWAAVGPDGVIDRSSVRNSSEDVEYAVGRRCHNNGVKGWMYAQRAGWRVIPVTITPREEQK